MKQKNPRKRIDLVGQRFGKLLVLKLYDINKWRNSVWLCRCDCGQIKTIQHSHLKSGAIVSCGCFNMEKSLKHGHAKNGKSSKIYMAWDAMHQRCTNSKTENFNRYGGRGIRVCVRWKKFENFLKDMGEPPTQQHSINRIDNDGNYCKSNCEWALPKRQARNKRNNRLITYGGKTQCLIEWAEEFNIHERTIAYRLDQGWPIDRVFTQPVRKHQRVSA